MFNAITRHTVRTILLAATALSISCPAMAQDKTDPPVPPLIQPAQLPGLTLDDAIFRALEKSPVLGASTSRADAATASRSQAGALPNPEISIEAENIYGDGPYSGLDGAEITYGVSQLVELPGKRSNRLRVAESEKDRIHYSRDAAQLDLIRDVTIAYFEAVAATGELDILNEERKLATAVRDSVAAKVQAGREPPIQKNKAEIELSASKIACDRAERKAVAKRQLLASLMGGEGEGFILEAGGLPAMVEPGPLEAYRARLAGTPDIQSLGADVAQAEAALSLEKASTVPDPTLGVGVRQFRTDNSKAFVAGISIPIPVFNLNRAGIARAGHELNAAKLDQRGRQLSLNAELLQIYESFVSAYHEARELENSVLPGAEEAFSFARGGYDAGKFGYLDVLDAQRTLFEARKQYNEAVLDYHHQRAAIERITALHAHNTMPVKE